MNRTDPCYLVSLPYCCIYTDFVAYQVLKCSVGCSLYSFFDENYTCYLELKHQDLLFQVLFFYKFQKLINSFSGYLKKQTY